MPSLKVKWAFGFPDTTTAYSQPTVVGGKVYTGSNDGTVYAINAQTGCLYWRFQAKSMVRDAVVIGGGRAYFGDLESNFYALDANTGKLIWQKKLDSQPYAPSPEPQSCTMADCTCPSPRRKRTPVRIRFTLAACSAAG